MKSTHLTEVGYSKAEQNTYKGLVNVVFRLVRRFQISWDDQLAPPAG